MNLIRQHPVFSAVWIIGLPIWAAFALAGLEALIVVLLIEALALVVKGLWQ